MRSRLYRYFAMAFAGMGLIVFLMIYFRSFDGDITRVMSSPILVMVMVIPFLPAAVLSWISSNTEKKLRQLVQDSKKGG